MVKPILQQIFILINPFQCYLSWAKYKKGGVGNLGGLHKIGAVKNSPSTMQVKHQISDTDIGTKLTPLYAYIFINNIEIK